MFSSHQLLAQFNSISTALQTGDQTQVAAVCTETLRAWGYQVQPPEYPNSLDPVYGAAFEHCPTGMLIHEVGHDGSYFPYCAANATACRLLGYSSVELLQRSPQDIDLSFGNLGIGAGKNSVERLFLTKSGTKIRLNISIKVILIQGRRWAVTFLPDPSLQVAEYRLQALLNAVPGYISWIDPDDRYLGVNQKLADSLNLSIGEIVGQKVGFMFEDNQFARFIQEFRDSPQLSASMISDAKLLNSERPASYLIAAQKDQNQQIVIVGIDITEQEKAKADLEELNQLLEAKVKERTIELDTVNQKLTREIEERQRIEHSLSSHLKRVETAYRMVFAMNQAETLEDIYSRSVRGMMSIFQVGCLAILLADEQGMMRFKLARGMTEQLRKNLERVVQDRSRYLNDANTQPMLYYDTIGLPFPQDLQDQMRDQGIEAMVIFPLIHNGLVIGEIAIYSDHALKLSPEEVQMGKTIATYIAVAITRKQTEISLRKSESQFRQIFRDATFGMALANMRTRRLIRVNSALCQMLGYSEVELLSLTIDDVTDPQDLSKDMRHLLQASYGQVESYRLEKRFLRQDGKIFWASSSVTVLRDMDGHPTSILVMVEDISDRMAAADQTRKTAALKLELDREKELNNLRTKFFSMASHEFRTPIGAILMNANILEYANDTALNHKSLRSLQRIRANVKHLTALLDDVLTLNRADTGKLAYRPELQELRELCQKVIEEWFSEDQYLDRIKFLPQGDRPYLAMIDQKLFHHMLTNLLANALKYSQEQVLVELAAVELGTISLKVSDRGIGIPSQDLPMLFDPFYRGENVGKVTGSGLGLTIVKKTVEMHDGTITVESELGVGTTFRVVLPSCFP
ncbi:MAG: PAS domain S-box protein [Pseudanabaenaceae cyanobacterium bins.68]|nr:PAS domain S-box protein [Pseudanabaenaceae cyanobacterium bins.68]